MTNRVGSVLVAVLAVLAIGCGDLLVGADPPDTPESNFELFWHEYDRWYGLFEVKRVDWDAVYEEYRPKVTDTTTDQELATIMSEMLDGLNDCHLGLETWRRSYFCSLLDRPTHFSMWQVQQRYLQGASEVEPDDYGGSKMIYGRVGADIGYLHISTFAGDNLYGADEWGEAMEQVLDAFASTRGIILDIRDNGGGNLDNARAVASYLADQERPYMVSRTRNGPLHTDFTAPFTFRMRPLRDRPYTGRVILLTNRKTMSASEGFTLALRQLPNVVHVGDTTTGAMSRVASERHLPNGWVYWMSVQDVRGVDGRSYEGVGIAPDSVVVNRERGGPMDVDEMIEAAVGIIG